MAEYERNGQIFTERSTVHNNWLTVEGFNTDKEVEAKLYTVNKSGLCSDPITVRFVPKESHISMAFKSMKLEVGFMGVVASWENISKTELGVRLMFDSIGKMREKAMYFSRLNPERHAFRGFDTITYKFGVSFTDKWGNISDTAYLTCQPLFEKEVEKPFGDMRTFVSWDNALPGTNARLGFNELCNFITEDPETRDGADAFLASATSDSRQAQASFTLDLKAAYKLSRMKMWPRTRSYIQGLRESPWIDIYAVNNVLTFELWGTKAQQSDWDPDKHGLGYWLDDFSLTAPTFTPGIQIAERTFKDDWQYLGYFAVPRYDLMGYSGEDQIILRNQGWEFNFDINLEPVQYIRFMVRSTDKGSPPPNSSFQITELSFWGDNRIK